MMICLCNASSVDPDDILESHGQFEIHANLDALNEKWKLVSTQYEQALSENSLIMTKPKDAKQTFDDGALIRFPLSKPQHLTFWCRTNDETLESCDVRLF